MKDVRFPFFCLFAAGLLACGCGSSSNTSAPPPVFTVSISAQRAALATTQKFSITATTNDASGVNWTATGGSFSSQTSLTGVAVTYTSPNVAGSYAITASSVTSAASSASMTVFVTDLAGVTTYHNDLARDGVNNQEYALSAATVTTSTFGKLFSCAVDGAIYTQPLWVPNLTVNGATHNVVLVATQHDSLFAFDADSSPCVMLWSANLIDANHGAGAGETSVPSGPAGYLVGSGGGDIMPEVGVTGTPVIDPSTDTLYVVSKSMNSAGTEFYQRFHAIDITTGNEKFGGPANIGPSITFPGTGDGGATVSFNARQQNQRPGLALVDGVVYVAWASHEDTLPYYGWVVGFNASSLAVTNVLNVSPNVQYGGIWMSGGAPAADNNNHLYLITGNATFDANNAGAPNNDYGDSFLQLTESLAITSYFTPSDEVSDAENDFDFGSGGTAVVLNVNSGAIKHLVIGGGKDGNLYLLNGDVMGGMGDANSRQHFFIGGAIFATGAFWNNNFYIAPTAGSLEAFSFDAATNLFGTGATSTSTTVYSFPGTTPSVSATGNSNGIVWALDNTLYCTSQSPGCGPAVLHAYSAANLSTDLWNSGMEAGDAAGNAVKFTVPTVANGKVYVGTRGNNTGGAGNSTTVPGELVIYGLKQN
jgi:hypothetical protein